MGWSPVVEALSLDRVPLTRHRYKMRLVLGGQVFERMTDDNLGHVMSVCSDLWKSIALTCGMEISTKETTIVTSPIHLNEMGIASSFTAGERWSLKMVSGPYVYVAGMDETLTSVVQAWMGAMRFFGFKYGYTTLDAEVTRNREQAVLSGVATKEDHVKRAKVRR